jgi:hypothetical protein
VIGESAPTGIVKRTVEVAAIGGAAGVLPEGSAAWLPSEPVWSAPPQPALSARLLPTIRVVKRVRVRMLHASFD